MSQDEVVVGEKYKVWTKGTKKKKKMKISKITEINDCNIMAITASGKIVVIPFSRTTGIKKRKFSLVKTIGLPVVFFGGMIALFLLTLDFKISIRSLEFPNKKICPKSYWLENLGHLVSREI